MKFGRIVFPVNVHQLMESYFWFDITLSRWQPWLIWCRRVLPPGE